MNRSVEQAIVNNPDSVANQSWNDVGLKACRNFALRSNHQFTDKILNGVFRPYYIIGFCEGWQKVERGYVQISEAQEQIRTEKERYRQLQSEFEQVRKRNQFLEKERECYAENLSTAQTRRFFAEKREKEIKAENEMLRKTNDELIQAMLQSHEEPVEQVIGLEAKKQQDAEQRASNLLLSGKSIREVSRITGISFYYVNKLRAELIASGEEVGKITMLPSKMAEG
ncbi:MAG: hypothetical protein KBT01_07820 [Clostridiales bacterium]|nr:hypothetical protein [Candidatus Blautia equi]